MFIKRCFDLFSALIGLIVLSPFLLMIAFLIKISSRGPIFFRQQRVGKNEVLFSIHKFRTMVTDAESIGPKITIGRDSRITSIGHILRKSKLDELPQLIDVVKGDMSIVGPRPEVPDYVLLYPESIRQVVFSVRPGITDWASILMIDENELLAVSEDPKATYLDVIMPQKLAYAVKYVKTRTFWQDCVIILTTLKKIVKR